MLPTIRKTTIFQKFKGYGSNETEKVFFEDNEDLRNVRIWGINTYYAGKNSVTMERDPNYILGIISLPRLLHSFLNLYDTNGVNFCKNIPLINFATMQNNSSDFSGDKFQSAVVERDNKFFTGQKLDLQNSFVVINEHFTNTFVLPLEIYYTRIDLDENNLDKLIK